MHLKIPSAKWWPSCFGLNVSRSHWDLIWRQFWSINLILQYITSNNDDLPWIRISGTHFNGIWIKMKFESKCNDFQTRQCFWICLQNKDHVVAFWMVKVWACKSCDTSMSPWNGPYQWAIVGLEILYRLGPLLLTWFNFNPSMDK